MKSIFNRIFPLWGERPFLVAVAVFLLSSLATGGLVARLEYQRREQYRSDVAALAADHAADLRQRLDQAFSATYALGVLVRQGKGDISDFESVARSMLPLYPGVAAMQLAPGGVVRKIFPLEGNEAALGHDILHDPRRAEEGRLTQTSRTLTLAGPFILKQGGVGAIARLPVFLDHDGGGQSFWGFTNVLIRFPEAIEQSQLSQLARRGFAFRLARLHPDTRKIEVIYQSTDALLEAPVEQRIEVPNGNWTLSIAPVAGWGSPLRLALDSAVGLLFSLLLAWVAKLLAESKAHEVELERLVQVRTAEIVEGRERLRMLEDNLPDSYLYQYLHGLDGNARFVYLSAGVEKVHGVSREEALLDATVLRGLMDPDQVPAMVAAERAALEAMRDFEVEVRMRGASGDWHWLQLRSRPRRTSEGEILWDGVAIDVTDRREAEVALRDERDFSNILLNSLPGVFYLYDDALTFLRWNGNLEHVTGYTAEEIARLSPLDFFAAEDRGAVAACIKKVFDEGEAEIEADLVTRNGARIPYYFTGLQTAIAGRTCLVGVGLDVSERKRLEEQLFQSQKMESIGQLAGGIAHDFNNILHVITGYCSNLSRSSQIEARGQDAVRHIAAAAERASQLTRSLLAFSRKQIMQLKQVNLVDVVQNVQEFLVRVIGEDIRLKIIINDPYLPVRVDTGQVEQILMNLATNARDAMHGGGLLTVETGLKVLDAPFEHTHGQGAPGRYAVIVVSDTGCGMDDKTRARLFEPFFTTKEVGRGTGLGMAVVYGLVRQHGGYINVYSEVGHGTVFRIFLPLAEDAEVHEEAESESAEVVPEGGGETILLVEDDPDVRELMVTVLQDHGYTVIDASDGNAGVAAFRENRERIELILMDLIMPGKNGIDAYREIAKLKEGVKVLYLSGYTADFIQSRGLTNEPIDLVMKPVQQTELLRKIREVLAR